MSDHTEYQRTVAHRIEMAIIDGKNASVELPDVIAAVLAAEGVVDPAGHQHTRDTLLKSLKRCENYERNLAARDAEIERLEALT